MALLTPRVGSLIAASCALAVLSCPVASKPTAPVAPQPAPAIASSAAVLDLAPAAVEQILAVEDSEPPPALPEELPANAKDSEPDEEPAVAAAEAGNDRFELAAIGREAWIHAKPAWRSRKIGYLRGGTVMERDERPAGFSGCDKGWYRIRPRGYVCVGKTASLETTHAVVEAAAVRPDRDKGLPYAYAMSRFPPPPYYVRLPTAEEQAKAEPDLERHLKGKTDVEGFAAIAGPVPGALLYERTLPNLDGHAYATGAVQVGRPVPRSGFGLLEVFAWTDRFFGLTTDLMLVPLDRTRFIAASKLQGVRLEPGQGLPAAFVRSRAARQYKVDLEARTAQDAGAVEYRQGFALTGRKLNLGGRVLLETRAGTWIQESGETVVIPPLTNVPGWATAGRKWSDVSILRQTLVAYEGTQPVYATLVSTGADGLGDPKETHSTVRGVFVIHTKHVTATMDGDETGDVFDLRDVPYVQYFTDGYAIHGAYWHDEFGTPHSHGCVNVAPRDASWLFAWTEPEVPEGWHARLQLRGGTIVYTHP